MTWTHLLSFNLRFLAGVLMEPMAVTTRKRWGHTSGSPTGGFACPGGNAVGVRVDAG